MAVGTRYDCVHVFACCVDMQVRVQLEAARVGVK
jgi:hypothetical protein